MFRFFYILYLLGKYGLILTLARYGFKKVEKPKLIKKFFEEASGAFIKFGQILALRVDIISNDYSIELLGLLDNVKPFSYKEVEKTFLNELGATPDKIFKTFSKEPFASASFGQVHGAELKDGKVVIVKVLRPDIETKTQIDFLVIDFLAAIADLFFKIEALPWKEFASEFRKWTKQELDYRIEAENGEKLYKNNVGNENLVIPRIYHDLTTQRILVEEYIEGLHLSKIFKRLKDGRLDEKKLTEMGVDLKKVARTLIWELLKQFFFNDFYHADPHPGNIIILKNNKIALIDFGIVGGEPLPNKIYFIKLAKATGDFDFKNATLWAGHFAADEMKTMILSALPATVAEKAVDELIRLLANFFSEAVKQICLDSGEDLKTMKKDFIKVILQVTKTAKEYKVELPKEFVIFTRTLAVLGLMAKYMDRDFRLIEILNAFFQVHPEEEITKNDPPPVIRRINREVALERLGNWIAYLNEIDPPVYHLVNNYLSRYNLFDK